MSDILQRLVTNNLTPDERRGVSDFNRDFDTEEIQPLEPIAVSFYLNPNQKHAIYLDVKNRIIDGKSPDDIALSVVACIEEHLKEKQAEAYGFVKDFTNPKSGKKGGFRRVE
jgi:hypothetical protein